MFHQLLGPGGTWCAMSSSSSSRVVHNGKGRWRCGCRGRTGRKDDDWFGFGAVSAEDMAVDMSFSPIALVMSKIGRFAVGVDTGEAQLVVHQNGYRYRTCLGIHVKLQGIPS
jgi:hypothetical protein